MGQSLVSPDFLQEFKSSRTSEEFFTVHQTPQALTTRPPLHHHCRLLVQLRHSHIIPATDSAVAHHQVWLTAFATPSRPCGGPLAHIPPRLPPTPPPTIGTAAHRQHRRGRSVVSPASKRSTPGSRFGITVLPGRSRPHQRNTRVTVRHGRD